jgi:hypothetical protein
VIGAAPLRAGRRVSSVDLDRDPGDRPPETKRRKITMLVIATLVFVATLVLCCVALRLVGRLFDIDPRLL